MKYSLGISNFLDKISSFPFYCFPLVLCIDCWGRLSYLSLPFFGTLHSNRYIFPFLLCFLLLFFSQLFVRLPQITILPSCISFSWGCSWSLPPVQFQEPELTLFTNPLCCLCHYTVIAHRLWKAMPGKMRSSFTPNIQFNYWNTEGISSQSTRSGRWFSSVRRLWRGHRKFDNPLPFFTHAEC